MPFLLDTNALSELTRPKPNVGFVAWMSATTTRDTYVSALSIAELMLGIELLPPSKKRLMMESWFTKIRDGFQDRILNFDMAAAREWSHLQAQARRTHKPIPIVDAQIGATAVAHGLIVVTRNERHFHVRGYDKLQTLNPWT